MHAQSEPMQYNLPFTLVLQTVFADGNELKVAAQVPDKCGASVDQTFAVVVPYEEDVATKTRTELQTRTVPLMVLELVPLGDEYEFLTLKGEPVAQSDLLKKVPMAGLEDTVMFDKPSDGVVQLFRDDVIVMRPISKPQK
ncbi:MAG TPA: hypothetical protein PKD64_12155 [Pirellulaceae bacterium]|nr:hypothetical protein [Pirellulaceae bacterium]HMO92939.1 hypothetical protein [Pirellulaceae bacterium]HMP68496.1 hypothetical protein [Pirellulaceae bacterium]